MTLTTFEDEPTAIDKLGMIEDWVQGVKNTLATESISYGELAQIDHIYDSAKEFLKGE